MTEEERIRDLLMSGEFSNVVLAIRAGRELMNDAEMIFLLRNIEMRENTYPHFLIQTETFSVGVGTRRRFIVGGKKMECEYVKPNYAKIKKPR